MFGTGVAAWLTYGLVKPDLAVSVTNAVTRLLVVALVLLKAVVAAGGGSGAAGGR